MWSGCGAVHAGAMGFPAAMSRQCGFGGSHISCSAEVALEAASRDQPTPLQSLTPSSDSSRSELSSPTGLIPPLSCAKHCSRHLFCISMDIPKQQPVLCMVRRRCSKSCALGASMKLLVHATCTAHAVYAARGANLPAVCRRIIWELKLPQNQAGLIVDS